jgi:hypothetical protein
MLNVPHFWMVLFWGAPKEHMIVDHFLGSPWISVAFLIYWTASYMEIIMGISRGPFWGLLKT